jgi:hypothetical protein
MLYMLCKLSTYCNFRLEWMISDIRSVFRTVSATLIKRSASVERRRRQGDTYKWDILPIHSSFKQIDMVMVYGESCHMPCIHELIAKKSPIMPKWQSTYRYRIRSPLRLPRHLHLFVLQVLVLDLYHEIMIFIITSYMHNKWVTFTSGSGLECNIIFTLVFCFCILLLSKWVHSI